ncbi:MAG: CPBP family intramembrane metalloprotease [Nitrospirae bacterium]|nr:CPBP family intramembrane metalloprotease [Nitrospirota bacterium]
MSEVPRPERWSGLAILPAVLSLGYSFGSPVSSGSLWTAVIPQWVAYVCLAVWCAANDGCRERLFIGTRNLKRGFWIGMAVGLITGLLNLWIIVGLTPWLGYGFDFLRDTPHAKMPFAVMAPWGIVLIAIFVELNFRGFLLGRLSVLLGDKPYGPAAAVVLSALVFSFDPFMVTVFRGYHWLAFTDGLIWGGLLIATRNLISTITAHAVEVILVYTVLKVFYA